VKNSQGIEIEDSKVVGMLIAYVDMYINGAWGSPAEKSAIEDIINQTSAHLLNSGVAVEWEI